MNRFYLTLIIVFYLGGICCKAQNSDKHISWMEVDSLINSRIFFCAHYHSIGYSHEIFCSCYLSDKFQLPINVQRRIIPDFMIGYDSKKRIRSVLRGRYVYEIPLKKNDTIFDIILNQCDSATRKKIEYSYSNQNDTIFNNLIDFNNKVSIALDVFYYPINTKGRKISFYKVPIPSKEMKWFESVMPDWKLRLCPDCNNIEKKRLALFLYLPYLDDIDFDE
jgi:hypothetical protein